MSKRSHSPLEFGVAKRVKTDMVRALEEMSLKKRALDVGVPHPTDKRFRVDDGLHGTMMREIRGAPPSMGRQTACATMSRLRALVSTLETTVALARERTYGLELIVKTQAKLIRKLNAELLSCPASAPTIPFYVTAY